MKQILACFLLFVSLFSNMAPAYAQQAGAAHAISLVTADEDTGGRYKNLLRQTRGMEYEALLERIFGSETEAAIGVFDEGSADLLQAVTSGAGERAAENLEKQISQRKESSRQEPAAAPDVKAKPAGKTAPRSKKLGFHIPPRTDWRRFAFGFQPLQQQDERPDVKMTETDKEIKAEGSDKKTFENKEAKGTRTQKVETKYTKHGKTFGVEIKDTQIIDAVSKTDGKSFHRELSLVWGAEVAACPDVNGISAGTGKAKVISKTTYTENGAAVTMTSEFDLQAKLTGYANDEAVLTHYDLQLDAYVTNSGYEDALSRGVIKEIKIRDGRYGLHYDIPGNTVEVSDGTYGGKRTPAKMGKDTARLLTPMSDADVALVGKAIGQMVPTIWNSANEMYKSAEKNWKNNGCVEIVARAPKSTLKEGEEVAVSAETVHLQDRAKVNANLNAEAFNGQITPESQTGRPGATFTFTQAGEDTPLLTIRSVSKRGIGEADIEFQLEKEKENGEPGTWTGTITAERKQREEREKRSGANLAENGGYLETATNVRLQLTGMLDSSVDAANAYIANITGAQKLVDHEYDRYKIDEGYCGPNAVPYKGPKEITRTSTTTANYGSETRVFVEIGGTGGSVTFSLPETNGTTVHQYVHKSPCAEHDRANTSEASDENAPTPGGSFSVSFPVTPGQKTIKGSITVQEEDGSTTTYTWELSRR